LEIKLTSVPVDDQEKALGFYTQVLGFTRRQLCHGADRGDGLEHGADQRHLRQPDPDHATGALVTPAFYSLSQEAPLDWNKLVRQVHRWLSIVFTATVIANFVAMSLGKPPAWVVYSPLLPLFLLLFSGLYMFALPYAVRWRGDAERQRTGPA
jgi:hypothetical protein